MGCDKMSISVELGNEWAEMSATQTTILEVVVPHLIILKRTDTR